MFPPFYLSLQHTESQELLFCNEAVDETRSEEDVVVADHDIIEPVDIDALYYFIHDRPFRRIFIEPENSRPRDFRGRRLPFHANPTLLHVNLPRCAQFSNNVGSVVIFKSQINPNHQHTRATMNWRDGASIRWASATRHAASQNAGKLKRETCEVHG